MERRAFQRIPSEIRARFFCNDTDYSATITDISENGMYLKMDQVFFPFESLLSIFMHMKDIVSTVPVKVCRLSRSNDIFDGIGVKVLHPVPEYVQLVRELKLVARDPL